MKLYNEELYTDYSELTLMVACQPQRVAEAGADFVNHQAWAIQSAINDLLRAKYTIPFAVVPARVKFWIARIITPKVVERTGLDPTDTMYLRFVEDARLAWDEIKAEASSSTSNLGSPLSQTASTTIAVGYSQFDPATWSRVQADKARGERGGRGGTIL